MAKYRRNRINDAVVCEMAEIVRAIQDPRIAGALVTVTAADVTPDLKFAKIYYSVLAGEADEVQKGLKNAAGFIRSQLAQRLNLRLTPELSFHRDDSIAYGANIAAILNELDISDDDGDETESD